jgi:hypothetical protein
MLIRMHWMTIAAGACAMAIALGGCSRSFTAREYPTFYEPDIRTVAVVTFRNDTRMPGAGVFAAEDLAMALRINGTYSVVPPRRLRSLLSAKKLEPPSRTDYTRDAEEFRKLGGIQAFIVGRVLHGRSTTERYAADYGYPAPYLADETFMEPARYQLVDEEGDEGEGGEGEEGFGDDFDDDYGDFGPFYPYGYWDYPEYSVRASVSIEATMVRVSDGQIMRTTTSPVKGRASLSSYRRIAPGSATVDAMHRAVARLVREFAAVPIKVKVNPRTDIRTAAGRLDGQWQFSNTFSPTDDRLFVVLRLPFDVAHDSFRVTITPKGRTYRALASRDLVWPVGAETQNVEFSPREMAPHMGAGEYTANLYARGQLVMQHDFTMK